MEIQMLKANNGGLELDSAMSRSKEQEFIDHTLLAPEYLRDSNNFIMDLIDNPAVFQKSAVNVSPTQTDAGDFSVKESLASELNFPAPIFQFVNKPSELNDSVNGGLGSVNLAASSDGNAAAFMSLNANDFLTNDGKSFCGAVERNHVETTSVAVQQFPSLSLLAEPNVTINNESADVMYTRSNARKVLPHKKRISRKLKADQADDCQPIMVNALKQHKLPSEERLVVSGALQFSCEICGHSTSSQLHFFAHLKQHYEPNHSHTVIASMKTNLDELEEPGKDCRSKTLFKKSFASSPHSQLQSVSTVNNVDHVFNDVHLNFANFHNVQDSVRAVMKPNNQEHNLKILNSHSMDKCINFVAQRETAPLKDLGAVEVEFSDNEDMLEGIRNVVDKVSVEDTCDDIDLMASTGIRAPWFTNDTFSGITFKSKSFGEVSFSGALERLPPTQTSGTLAEVPLAVPKQPLDSCVSPSIKVTTKNTKGLLPFDDATAVEDQKETFFVTTVIDDCLDPITATTTTSSLSSHKEINSNEVEERESLASDLSAHRNANKEEEDEDDGSEYEFIAEQQEPKEMACLKDTGRKLYFCTVAGCKRDFNSNNALRYHLRTHTGLRPHQCDVCGKSFFAQGALKAHIRTHTGDKPFQCEHCLQRFRQWSELKYHVDSKHTAEKAHQCEFCGKAFARKYSLVLHRRIHTSERNYKCDLCSKAFRASTYLNIHRRIHTGEKPFECNVCNKKFRVSGDLRRHQRIHLRKPYVKGKKSSQHSRKAAVKKKL